MEKGYDPETLIAAMIKKLVKFDLSEERDLNDIVPERRKSDRAKGASRDIGNSVRFHINLGKNQGIRPGDILGAIAGECDIPGTDIGAIEILDNYSFFNARAEHLDAILGRMEDAQIKGKDVVVEVSKEKKSRKSFDDRGFKPKKEDDFRVSRKKQGFRKKY